MKDITAVVLGGGQGTRLAPLTSHRSKPAVPVAGKYRLIDIPISNCINSGIMRVFVLTQFNSESLNRHVSRTYHFDQFTDGFVEILAAEQTFKSRDWFQGTADAVRKCFRHFVATNPSKILILSGDQLYRMDFRELARFHEEKGADVTIASIPVKAEEASSFGIMEIDDSFRIVNFVEKPPASQQEALRVTPAKTAGLPERVRNLLAQKPFLASMGIYLFRTEILERMLANEEHIDFGKHLIPQSIKEFNVVAYPFEGYWSDIGTIKSFFEENLNLTKANPEFDIYDAQFPIYTHARFLPASRIYRCQIHSSMVAEGCILSGALIWNSIVGIRARIGSGTEIRETMILGADYYEDAARLNENRRKGIPDVGIGSYCTIKRAIIDKNVRIGNNVQILNVNNVQEYECEQYVIRDGVVIIPKGGTVPDNTVI